MDNLIKEFNKIKKTDSFEVHHNYIKKLLSHENEAIYKIHYNFINDRKNTILHERICRAFAKRSEKAGSFLLEKALDKNTNNASIADIIQILGLMKFHKLISYIPYFLSYSDETIRYKCIIVLGWLGGKKEVSILNNILSPQSQEVDYIRGYSATAMRQIWFNHLELKEYILSLLFENLKNESSQLVNAMIIITIQDILDKKLGLKENDLGEISGDISKSKTKSLLTLDSFFHNQNKI
ncbi:hypothetical protein SAMN05660772_02782 [Pasteurella testudinis DSM 23072]|uniref:HEAT repeat-containing protein n=1 Tax=Pasteurella testudinis DSM 23072 TaxID=1122938 RepID=A0A1W1V3U4_9PAST|nr:HEAT repeat domain-containing protein [Pasteurella testudinis]SMB87956.1 hypothetical protein SAMN05660772_02782 [Pasteurella testudinis DSM 23072]SUB52178.1 Uncharacterised protein [Pasteurella testudinis]